MDNIPIIRKLLPWDDYGIFILGVIIMPDQKPARHRCGDSLVLDKERNEYVCQGCGEIVPLSQLTPLQEPSSVNKIVPVSVPVFGSERK